MNMKSEDYTGGNRPEAPNNSGITLPMTILMTIFIAVLSTMSLFASGLLSMIFILPHILAASALAYLALKLGKTKKIIVWTAISAALSYTLGCAACALLSGSMPSAVTDSQSTDGAVSMFVYALYSLIYILPALVLFVAVRFKSARSSTVAAVTAAFTAITLVIAAASLYSAYGTLAPDNLSAALSEDFETALEPLKEALLELEIETQNGTVSLYTEESVTELINSIMILLPAAGICILSVIAYITTSVFAFTVKLGGAEDMLPSRPWKFTMSIVSACVFVAAYLCGIFFASSKTTVIWAAAQNITLILTPGFALIGFRTAFGRKTVRHMKALVLPTLLLISLFIVPAIFVYLLTLVGLIEVFKAYFYEKHFNKTGGTAE